MTSGKDKDKDKGDHHSTLTLHLASFSHFNPCVFLSLVVVLYACPYHCNRPVLSSPFSFPFLLPLFPPDTHCCAIYFLVPRLKVGHEGLCSGTFKYLGCRFGSYLLPSQLLPFCIWLSPAYLFEQRSCLVDSFLNHLNVQFSFFFVTQRCKG